MQQSIMNTVAYFVSQLVANVFCIEYYYFLPNMNLSLVLNSQTMGQVIIIVITKYIIVVPTVDDIDECINILKELGGVLGILQNTETESIDDEIEELIAKRQEARKNKNFALADEIRDNLKAQGIVLEDTPNGVKWKRI